LIRFTGTITPVTTIPTTSKYGQNAHCCRAYRTDDQTAPTCNLAEQPPWFNTQQQSVGLGRQPKLLTLAGRIGISTPASTKKLHPVGLGHRPEPPRTLFGWIGTSTRATTLSSIGRLEWDVNPHRTHQRTTHTQLKQTTTSGWIGTNRITLNFARLDWDYTSLNGTPPGQIGTSTQVTTQPRP
jgi:hypothetical protein